jgi:O-antigen/teichoic acid export membrane protein
MNGYFASGHRLITSAISGVPERARWSFADQVLISGVNLLTGVLLVRALGLHDFGVFTLALIGIQFLASLQSSGILAPMMSIFDQRGAISQASYLAAVLLHQAFLLALVGVAIFIASFVPRAVAETPIGFGLAAAVIATTQFQDLARRYFYVTERPARAFLSDTIAYGARLAVLAVLAFRGLLTMDLVWVVIAATSAAAFLLLLPDILRVRVAVRAEVTEVTRRQGRIAGWLLGNTVVGWFSESNFVLLIVGAALGPVSLGAVRAVQILVQMANLLLQALENFVPSAATKSLVEGGAPALLRYVNRIASLGAAALVIMTIILMLLADPILTLLYGQTFPDQLAILAILGAYAAFGHVATIALAGLRALAIMRPAVLIQAVIAVISLAVAWPLATTWGVLGALGGVLAARGALTGSWMLLLRQKATTMTAS